MLLGEIDRLPASDQRLFRQRIGSLEFEIYRAAFPLSWVPLRVQSRLTTTLDQVVGPERAVATWQQIFARTTQQPMLKGLIEMVSKYAELGPSKLCRQSPRLYGYITRGCGELSWEPTHGDRGGRIDMFGLPERGHAFWAWTRGLQGCVLGAISSVGTTASATIEDADEQRGCAAIEVKW